MLKFKFNHTFLSLLRMQEADQCPTETVISIRNCENEKNWGQREINCTTIFFFVKPELPFLTVTFFPLWHSNVRKLPNCNTFYHMSNRFDLYCFGIHCRSRLDCIKKSYLVSDPIVLVKKVESVLA